MFKSLFTEYINATNLPGSGKATSYVRAMDLLGEMIAARPCGFNDCQSIWNVNSLERLNELHSFVVNEANKKVTSVWNLPNIPKSYLQNGYCSAAIKNYQRFLVEQIYENEILTQFESYKGNEEILSEELKAELDQKYLTQGVDGREGENILRTVFARVNQNIFRKMILAIYNHSCCITNLNIPELNRASHIIPWAEDSKTRLDPRNGLCLSATYDAAFDSHLISLDDDYRIILSKDLSEYFTRDSVKDYFLSKEGATISLPHSYLPSKIYLAKHRCLGEF